MDEAGFKYMGRRVFVWLVVVCDFVKRKVEA